MNDWMRCAAGVPPPTPPGLYSWVKGGTAVLRWPPLPAERPGRTREKGWKTPPARKYQAGRMRRLAPPAIWRGQQLAHPGIPGSIDVLSRVSFALLTMLDNFGPPMREPSRNGADASIANPLRPTLQPDAPKVCALCKNAHVHTFLSVPRLPDWSVNPAGYPVQRGRWGERPTPKPNAAAAGGHSGYANVVNTAGARSDAERKRRHHSWRLASLAGC